MTRRSLGVEQVSGERAEPCLGYVEFERSVQYPSTEVQEEVEYLSMEFGREA